MAGIRHVPGERMLADLGTKALASTRMEALKKMMGMGTAQAKKEVSIPDKDEEEIKTSSKLVTMMALKLITMAATLSASRAQNDEEEWPKVCGR